jgi:hypothetical protein
MNPSCLIWRRISLGRSYCKFVSYSGQDGQSLGVAITPHHVTELFCGLVKLKADDVILALVVGLAVFLVSGMHRHARNGQ